MMAFDLDHRVEILEREVKQLRERVREQEDQLEVLSTPWWKRWLWFVPQGWRPYTVGRWYQPRWS